MKRTPPPSCQELHAKYFDQLGKIQGMIVAVNDAVGKIQSDPSSALKALTEMQGKASVEADTSIQAADDALSAVCSKYHLQKDFDIKGDNSSLNMLR